MSKTLLLLMGACLLLKGVAFGQSYSDADGFDYAVSDVYRPTAERGDSDGWNNRVNPFANDPEANGCFHSGEDWNRDSGTSDDVGQPMKAIAHGRVVRSQVAMSAMVDIGGVVMIEHQYNGRTYCSSYEHVVPLVQVSLEVKRGDTVASIQDITRFGDHGHLSLREGACPTGRLYPNSGGLSDRGVRCLDGYYHSRDAMNLDGLTTPPTDFIDANRPLQLRRHPDGSFIRQVRTGTVYFLRDGVKYPINSESLMTNNGYNPRHDVIIVSSEELACYPTGLGVTSLSATSSPVALRPWGSFREGSTLRLEGRDEVYVVSNGKLWHVAVNGLTFPLVGFSWGDVRVVAMSVPASSIGGTFPLTWFHQCAMSEYQCRPTDTQCVAPPPNFTITTPPPSSTCTLSLNPPNQWFDGVGGSVTIQVTAQGTCDSWSVTSPESWISVTSFTGSGSGTVKLQIAANTSPNSRGNNIAIGGAVFRVDQEGTTVSSPPPSTTVTCTPTLNPTAKNFAGSGGSVSVSVSAASNCSWSVSLPESWIHASPLSGTGSTAITISVDKNPSTAVSRGNNVTIGGAIFRVDQDNSIASTPPPPATSNCATALSPTAKNFSGSGGSVTVNVSAPSTCTWGVSLPESWITSSASSGTGNGSVTITVAQNPSTAVSRGNNVTIGGLAFRVDQDNYIP